MSECLLEVTCSGSARITVSYPGEEEISRQKGLEVAKNSGRLHLSHASFSRRPTQTKLCVMGQAAGFTPGAGSHGRSLGRLKM